MMFYKYLALMLVRLISISMCVRVMEGHPDTKPPHIIFVLIDDWGHFDLNLNGMKAIPTPNMNRLARDGVYLNNYYVPPICTPSRASLLTGRYASNTGLQHYVIAGAQPKGLPLNFTILPQWLKRRGYVTRMIGKWHLGFYKRSFTPTFRGFESFYGFWNGESDFFTHHSVFSAPPRIFTNLPKDYPPDLANPPNALLDGYDFRDNMEIVKGKNMEYLTDIYTEKAVQMITEHQNDKPLFLYLAHHGVHSGNPQQEMSAPYKYTKFFDHIQDRERKQYAGALTAIDLSVGEMVAALERKGMLENSVIVVSSDNGAPLKGGLNSNGGSNYPLRGFKTSAFEGGTKAIGFVWSPRIKKPRTIWNGLMHSCDWLPTLYSVAGGNVSDLNSVDGVNMWHAISQNEKSPRNDLFIYYDQIFNYSSYRWNEYKLVTGLKGMVRDGDVISSGPLPSGESTADAVYCGKTYPGSDLVDEALNSFYSATPEYTNNSSYANFQQIKCSPHQSRWPENSCTVNNDYCLFNLHTDPCEMNNIAHENPEISKAMLEALKAYKDKAAPAQNQLCDYKANPSFHGGFWVPFEEPEHEIKPINCTATVKPQQT